MQNLAENGFFMFCVQLILHLKSIYTVTVLLNSTRVYSLIYKITHAIRYYFVAYIVVDFSLLTNTRIQLNIKMKNHQHSSLPLM